MRRASVVKALRFGISLLPFVLATGSLAEPYRLSSDSNFNWPVSVSRLDEAGNVQIDDLGNAQTVCLNDGANPAPANCPTGAMSYDYPHPGGWNADLTPIPGSKWIWAPKTSAAATTPLTGETTGAQNAEFTFQARVWICGTPTSGKIWAAADNEAKISLNGQNVLTSTGQNALSMVDLFSSPNLPRPQSGLNVVEVKGKNAANPGDCGSDKYNCNPAGVVVGGLFEDGLSALPTCAGNIPAGQTEVTPYTSGGQQCLRTRICACFGSNAILLPVSDQCISPPPTCTGANGGTFMVGQRETLSTCLPSGSRTRVCTDNGNGTASWGQVIDTCVATMPPAPTCTGADGRTFALGETETFPCTNSAEVGFRSRTCARQGVASAAWGSIVEQCRLPDTTVGAICGSRERGQTAICPSGTTCGPRLIPSGPRPPECAIFGINCPVRLQTADWFCD